MLRPRLLHHIAVYGTSLPTLAAPPIVAGATIYMPSQLAARVLGDCQPSEAATAQAAPIAHPNPDSSHAA